MKKEVWWLENRNNLILYLRAHKIHLKCVFKTAMMKRGGVAGSGIVISFLMRKKIKEYDAKGNVIEVEREAPVSRFSHKTKRKVMDLLNISADSKVEDCDKINEEVERRK